MRKIRAGEPQHRAVIDALMPRVEAAFTGSSFWQPFVREAHRHGVPRLDAWLVGTGQIVDDQFRRRGLGSTRPANMPLSTSPMDAFIHPVRDRLRPRAYALKNRERTNQMLMLMQLHANREDNERTYTKNIRQWLEASAGRPRVVRRGVVDASGVPSLR